MQLWRTGPSGPERNEWERFSSASRATPRSWGFGMLFPSTTGTQGSQSSLYVRKTCIIHWASLDKPPTPGTPGILLLTSQAVRTSVIWTGDVTQEGQTSHRQAAHLTTSKTCSPRHRAEEYNFPIPAIPWNCTRK